MKEEIKSWYPTIELSWLAQLWASYIESPWNKILVHGLNNITTQAHGQASFGSKLSTIDQLVTLS